MTGLTALPDRASTTTTTTTTGPAASGEGGNSRSAALAADFDTFLRMLTVQARNQDPLNPLDATDYATQLATFSGVEQQVVTNDLLGTIAASVGGSVLDNLRSWVGADVRAAVPARFDGTPVTVFTALAPDADAADLVIYDATGKQVDRRGVSLTEPVMHWDGTDAVGNPVPPGDYGFAVESMSDGEVIDTTTPEIYARVSEARIGQDNVTILVLADGTEIPDDRISGLRIVPDGI